MKNKLLRISFDLVLLIAITAVMVLPVFAAVDDSYSKILLHLDGSDTSTTITDESGKSWTVVGNAQLDTSQYKFSTASLLLDGSGDYIYTGDSGDYYFQSDDFTIDFWCRFNALPSSGNQMKLYAQYSNSSNEIAFGIVNSSGTYVWELWVINNGTSVFSQTFTQTSPSTNTWYHVALVRSGTSIKVFIDGSQIGSTATFSGSMPDIGASLKIGAGGDGTAYPFNGWIDEYRVSKGIARWTTNFTPPSSPYDVAATATPTPTSTSTSTPTYTPTYTPTGTNTPTQTNTPIPTADTIWASGTVTLSDALTAAVGTLLKNQPPSGASGVVYAITYVAGSSTSWRISVVNLTGVSAPYEDWNIMENSAWTGSVLCEGSEPTWTCEFPTPETGGGGSGLIFPWSSGYSAKYGVKALHRDTLYPGAYAVDFVGSDNNAESMPPYAVSAAAGNITYICEDTYSMAVFVTGGPVTLAYLHFNVGNDFNYGPVNQGQVLGSLRYGPFSGPCGSASQDYQSYHLHFEFFPTSGNYFEIGGAVYDLTTQNFVMNGNTYSAGSYIPNGGNTSVPDPEGNDGGTNVSVGGGGHLWDGIVDAIVQINANTIAPLLPDQDPFIPAIFTKMALIIQVATSLFTVFFVSTATGTYLLLMAFTWITCEIMVLELKVAFFFAKLIF